MQYYSVIKNKKIERILDFFFHGREQYEKSTCFVAPLMMHKGKAVITGIRKSYQKLPETEGVRETEEVKQNVVQLVLIFCCL